MEFPSTLLSLWHTFPSKTPVLAASAGVLSHHVYFKFGQRDFEGHLIISKLMALQAVVTAYLINKHGLSCTTLYLSANFALCFLAGVFTSIIIYRIFFHPLAHFKGPFWGKVSDAIGLYYSRDGRFTWEMEKVASAYEDEFVRIKPNVLLSTDVDLWVHMNSPATAFTKIPDYATVNVRGMSILFNDIDTAHHAMRRQIWEKSFTAAALRGYEPAVVEVTKTFLDVVSEKIKTDGFVDVSAYALLWVTDVMGKVGFSRDFHATVTGKSDIVRLLTALFSPVSKIGRWVWPVALMTALGIQPQVMKDWEDWSYDVLMDRVERKKNGEQLQDMMTPLIKAWEENADGKSKDNNDALLQADSQGVIVAATDTVANSISWVFYYLCQNPEYQAKLRSALAPLMETSPAPTNNDLSTVHLLNAVINETLRLQNAVSSAGRLVPKEGFMWKDTFLPGGTSVCSSPRNFGRSPKCFVEPLMWFPERWMPEEAGGRPEMTLNRKGMTAFSWGQWNCVGKQFALQELRILFAHTVWNFDLKFAPGETGKRIEDESKDFIIMKAAPLNVTFQPVRRPM